MARRRIHVSVDEAVYLTQTAGSKIIFTLTPTTRDCQPIPTIWKTVALTSDGPSGSKPPRENIFEYNTQLKLGLVRNDHNRYAFSGESTTIHGGQAFSWVNAEDCAVQLLKRHMKPGTQQSTLIVKNKSNREVEMAIGILSSTPGATTVGEAKPIAILRQSSETQLYLSRHMVLRAYYSSNPRHVESSVINYEEVCCLNGADGKPWSTKLGELEAISAFRISVSGNGKDIRIGDYPLIHLKHLTDTFTSAKMRRSLGALDTSLEIFRLRLMEVQTHSQAMPSLVLAIRRMRETSTHALVELDEPLDGNIEPFELLAEKLENALITAFEVLPAVLAPASTGMAGKLKDLPHLLEVVATAVHDVAMHITYRQVSFRDTLSSSPMASEPTYIRPPRTYIPVPQVIDQVMPAVGALNDIVQKHDERLRVYASQSERVETTLHVWQERMQGEIRMVATANHTQIMALREQLEEVNRKMEGLHGGFTRLTGDVHSLDQRHQEHGGMLEALRRRQTGFKDDVDRILGFTMGSADSE
ncbi:hypothetical protein BXZ70DRAFT_97863 [Cristinia sonorae]|uniref:Uncharacterized protein n=1 Tax=Cristinia sonorae TaxID=1940300 RepID=A0A8K0US99_9AGAR|nr:hypothetical protein BXZ70DRAFT_97863 [Cristinia sonorae]